MTAPTIDRTTVATPPKADQPDTDFELDITFLEVGDSVQHIIKMTGDNCGATCESACTSC
jgi:FxLD family lantipeptide